MSTGDALLGLGLVIVLAVGSQLLAGRLRLPAIVVLRPVGFLALRTELGHGRVYRAAPDLDETDLFPPAGEQGILGTDMLPSAQLGRRFAAGARLVEAPPDGGPQPGAGSNGQVALFVVTPGGDLRVASAAKAPPVKAGDRVIALVGVV